MRTYPETLDRWQTSHGSDIAIKDLHTDHLANIIDFLRWDAAKELGFTKRGSWAFKFNDYDPRARRRIASLIQAKVPCWWNLRAEAIKRRVYSIVENCRELYKKQVERERQTRVAIDIETRHQERLANLIKPFFYQPNYENSKDEEIRLRPPAAERARPGFVSHEAFSKLEQRLAQMEARNATHTAHVDLESRVSTLEDRRKVMHDNMSALFEVAHKDHKRIEEVEKTVVLNTEGLSSHRGELNDLERRLHGVERQMKLLFGDRDKQWNAILTLQSHQTKPAVAKRKKRPSSRKSKRSSSAKA